MKFNCFCDVSADEILNVKQTERSKPSVKKDELCDRILEMFGDEETIEVPKNSELCDRLECKPTTLRRALNELGIKSRSKGFGKDKKTFWYLDEVK